MRKHGEYIPLSQEQITAAQHTDLVEYLRGRGEKLRKSGSHYIWKEHDSCVITGYMWYQNSTGKHGAAVAFVQHFFGLSFPQAVLELLQNKQLSIDIPPPERSKQKPPKADALPVAFVLPESAPDHRRLFAYLTQTRGITADIVTEFLQDHLIYQDIHGNIVFVCYDQYGRVRAAHRRGTNTSRRYRGFVTGGDFSCGFSYTGIDASTLYVFEAPIDLMSYITLHRHEPWHKNSYLSLGGLADDPLKQFLKENKSIQTLIFCLDNDADKPDNPGQNTAKKLARQYASKYTTYIEQPELKDWNDVLRMKLEKRERI